MLPEIEYQTPERASSLHRRVLCKGSRIAEKDLPSQDSDDSTEGTTLHAVMSGVKGVNLTLDQSDVIVKTGALRQDLILEVFGENCGDIEIETDVEMLLRDDAGHVILSGHADIILNSPSLDRALIIDYKFGRIPVDPAEVNYQLRSYALLTWKLYQVAEVYAGIVQPRVEADLQKSLVKYEGDDLKIALADVGRVIAECCEPDAVRSPCLDACRYCKAKGTARCPESIQVVPEIVAYVPSELSAGEVGVLLEKCQLAQKVIDAIKDRAKDTIKGGGVIPGWQLSAGRKERKIKDPAKAFAVLATVIPQEDFVKCCKVGITALRDAYRRAVGCKAKDADQQLENALGDIMEITTTEGSLQKV